MRNPYEVLGVVSTASEKELKQAFHAGVRRTHPDMVGTHDHVEAYTEIIWAYQILSDPSLRSVWDEDSRTSDTKDGTIFQRIKKTASVSRAYVCRRCGARHCKLWRDTQDLADATLFCVNCAFEVSGTVVTPVDAVGLRVYRIGTLNIQTDGIGPFVPAVPVRANTRQCWPYTMVPEQAANWWKDLPTYPHAQLPTHPSRPILSKHGSVALPHNP